LIVCAIETDPHGFNSSGENTQENPNAATRAVLEREASRLSGNGEHKNELSS